MFGPVVGSVVGVIFIGIYLKYGRGKKEYKTIPIYGISALMQGYSGLFPERYEMALTAIAFLLLGIALYIDFKYKKGLCLLITGEDGG